LPVWLPVFFSAILVLAFPGHVSVAAILVLAFHGHVSVAAILVLAFPGHVSVAAILRLGHLASMCLLPLLQFLLAFPFSKLLFLIILFFPALSFGEGESNSFLISILPSLLTS
jgi:hypothetical protein